MENAIEYCIRCYRKTNSTNIQLLLKSCSQLKPPSSRISKEEAYILSIRILDHYQVLLDQLKSLQASNPYMANIEAERIGHVIKKYGDSIADLEFFLME
jgi:hypothetical protein